MKQDDVKDKNKHADINKNPEPENLTDEGATIEARFEKAKALKAEGLKLYPNTFVPIHKAASLQKQFKETTKEEFEKQEDIFTIAGRIMARRDYGKSIFFDVEDSSGKIQAYVQAKNKEAFTLFKKLDIGDIIGFTGRLFKTQTGELTVLINTLELVTKGLWPLPEKYHDINIETKYRQRYVDLIMNRESKNIFLIRSKTISAIRKFMEKNGFLEVETPMLHAIPGGAAAKPFETFHNALNTKLYLKIAPELYLKRLLVGGFDKVFEINRCFRNEGLSIQHNPEFTMMEFYQSYAQVEDLIGFTEELFSFVATEVLGTTEIVYQGQNISFKAPWQKITWHQALVEIGGWSSEVINNYEKAAQTIKELGGIVEESEPLGKLQEKLFDLTVEDKLIAPTFITGYPADISPLARRNDENPELTDRFELFIVGRELANAFSELNDPLDQRERFLAQVAEREAGDEEGMYLDADYVRALKYGMPPAAGEGIGVDRLVMLLANVASIKDIILFPHMRPQAKSGEGL